MEKLTGSRVAVCENSMLPEHLITSIRWRAGEAEELDGRAGREWLVTNGLGGYASGSVVGAITRRYHGLLIAALPAPLGRVMMFNHVSERLRFPDRTVEWLSAYGLRGKLAQAEGTRHLAEFRLEAGIPTWRYQVRDAIVERTVLMPYGQNTVYLTYRLVSGAEAVRLAVRPLLGFRPHDSPVESSATEGYTLSSRDRRIEIQGDTHLPMLRLVLHAAGGAFTIEDQAIKDVKYLVEQGRGYGHSGPLWSPGYFRAELRPDSPVTLIASTEAWDMIAAVNPEDGCTAERRRREGLLRAAPVSDTSRVASQLVLAADQFVTRATARVADEARARGGGSEARTIIAGYHWFTDWGRDTMISLEGLALLTGRHSEARDILRTFAWHVRDGLIPNLFPEGQREGLYHTADATLWFFHALSRYETVTGDTALTTELIPKLTDIVRHHHEGTRFGIHVADDGLLEQGAADYPLTWMDAKMDGWVVTPRRGKAVEINALWYNAQCLLGQWLHQRGDLTAAADIEQQAARTRDAFNRRFWNPNTKFLFDVVDGERGHDDACRPNQVFALSLPNPVLDRSHWEPVLEAVRTRLLTPFGLRSLAPGHPDYKPRYFGDLRARDAAYHQGTVWSWLIGPFVDAWLALYPADRQQAAAFLEPLKGHLFDDGAMGSVSEIFDAEPPYTPRGCIAQAWSVAELLRADARASSEH